MKKPNWACRWAFEWLATVWGTQFLRDLSCHRTPIERFCVLLSLWATDLLSTDKHSRATQSQASCAHLTWVGRLSSTPVFAYSLAELSWVVALTLQWIWTRTHTSSLFHTGQSKESTVLLLSSQCQLRHQIPGHYSRKLEHHLNLYYQPRSLNLRMQRSSSLIVWELSLLVSDSHLVVRQDPMSYCLLVHREKQCALSRVIHWPLSQLLLNQIFLTTMLFWESQQVRRVLNLLTRTLWTRMQSARVQAEDSS